jgi:molybdate transport system ATP-binding protein
MLEVMLQHSFGEFSLDVNFQAPSGLTVLFGSSGSGKTSVIRAVAGLLKPGRGRIVMDGHVLLDREREVCVPPQKRHVGYIFQEGRLFPHLTVLDNLKFAERYTTGPSELEKVIELLGVHHLLKRRPQGLSGGEKQRVAIGRAVLAQPEILLADEPLAALDESRKAEILPYFERLRDEVGIPILYVSHSAAEVARLATTVVALDAGRVIGQGSAVALLSDPALTPVGTRAMGALLECEVSAHHADGLTELRSGNESLFVPQMDKLVGDRIRVRIPAHEVLVATTQPRDLSALNIMKGVVRAMSEEAEGTVLSISTSAGTVLARVTRRSSMRLDLAVGKSVFAVVKTVAIGPDEVSG